MFLMSFSLKIYILNERNITIKMILSISSVLTGLLKALLVLAVGEVGDQGQRIASYKITNFISFPYQSYELYKQEHPL